MSVEADIASLKLIAAMHQSSRSEESYDDLVHKLYSQVPHFEWVGLYLKKNGVLRQIASAGDDVSSPVYHHAILQIPLYDNEQEEIGKLMVATRDEATFDETDYQSLEVLAREISRRIVSVL
ncbi:hypothetical protein BSNK01_31510 [Bacillaceae bacterium]